MVDAVVRFLCLPVTISSLIVREKIAMDATSAIGNTRIGAKEDVNGSDPDGNAADQESASSVAAGGSKPSNQDMIRNFRERESRP